MWCIDDNNNNDDDDDDDVNDGNCNDIENDDDNNDDRNVDDDDTPSSTNRRCDWNVQYDRKKRIKNKEREGKKEQRLECASAVFFAF